MRLLLDEHLSPSVAVALARDDGVDICHVRDRGLLSAEDCDVFDKAYEEDRIIVTANTTDFEILARDRELHAGAVLIENGELLRDEQLVVLRTIIAKLAEVEDLVNQVLRVDRHGTMTIESCAKS